jgi:alanine-synthesizing transaminase
VDTSVGSMLSRRLPHDLEPNAWARLLEERRAAGAPLLDLAETNPTRVGLGGAGPEELAALAQAAGARYEPDPRGSRAAREAVAGYYAARGASVDPQRIVLTASTSESYTHLFRLLADPGGTFLVPSPSSPLFEPLAALEGVVLRPYRLAYDGAWHLDTHSFEQAFGADVRGVIVVQPNHPTGSCLEAGERETLTALCERHGAAIVADEVFGDFPRGGEALASFAGEARVPTFVLSGLSKVSGMPQMKLGWIAVDGSPAAREAALRGLEWIADLFLSVSTPVQVALPRLLAARGPFQERVRERLARNRAALDGLVAARPELGVLAAQGGWAAVLRVPRLRSEEEWALGLLRRDVVVHPGHFYDFADEGYLVLSLIPEPDVFHAGLARLAEFAAEG